MELFSIPAPRWTSTVHPDPVTSSRKAGGSNDRVASTVTVRKGSISVGQDGILRGDWQSPRVPVGNRHAACQAAPQKDSSMRSLYWCAHTANGLCTGWDLRNETPHRTRGETS